MWLLIVGGVCLFIFFAWLAYVQNQREIAKANRALQPISNFRPALTESTGWNKPSISIDPDSRPFAIIQPDQIPKVYHYDQLVAVEIERDGQSVTRTNRGSQAAGAAVGAALLGPAGLLLGGLTGSKRHEERIKRLSLKIYTNDLICPVVEIPFVSDWTGHNVESALIKNAAKRADEWYARFQAILQMRFAQ